MQQIYKKVDKMQRVWYFYYKRGVTMSNLGKRLKAYREMLGLTLKQVNEQTGITNSRLSKIERGQLVCPPADLKKLARIYEVQLISLYLEAGYIDNGDLMEYQLFFKGTNELDNEEKQHIQQQIDFMISRKRNSEDIEGGQGLCNLD